ncbi:MAG TPA: class I SAM-dependent methyltransferase [Rhodanobacteraceae bacterium]|nr:class I SAM-dependent methyltransferase [Rhodanobacteraceae bacterium]
MGSISKRFRFWKEPAPEPPPPSAPSPLPLPTAHPLGHFYSPVVDPEDARRDAPRLWPADIAPVAGIDFDDAAHTAVLETLFPAFYPGFDYPEEGAGDAELTTFYIRNSQFSWLDARALFVLFRHWRPRRVVEIGSGYSTLLMADINARFLDGAARITSIEPFPRPFLARMTGRIELIEKRVQDVPLRAFEALEAGDVLFLDSSHVAKTGSDVNFVFFEILPRLARGVRIHVHDIFLPMEYPKEWVIDENRSWNEQYLVRALLMYSNRFRVVFGCAHAYVRHRAALARALGVDPGKVYGGGSLWLEVV